MTNTFVLLFAVVITKRLLSPEKDAVVAQVTPVFVYSSVIAFLEFCVLFSAFEFLCFLNWCYMFDYEATTGFIDQR